MALLELMDLYFPPRLSLHFKWAFKSQEGARKDFQIPLPGSEDRDFWGVGDMKEGTPVVHHISPGISGLLALRYHVFF